MDRWRRSADPTRRLPNTARRYAPSASDRDRQDRRAEQAQTGRAHVVKIISADERLAEKSGAKILIIGPSGIGKTSLLRTMSAEMLASTLFVDIEAGHIAVADLPVASVRPQRWE